VEQLDVLRRAAQVPVRAPAVAGLVIAGAGVVGDPLVAGGAAAIDQVGAAGNGHDQQHRHAAPGQ
jgi:hypothetical protein